MMAVIRSMTLLALALVLGSAVRADSAPAGYDAGRLYNLGNSFARAGQPGLAVLNYERARLLSPTDADIETNLRHVREAAQLTAEPRSKLEILRMPNAWLVEASGMAGLLVAAVSGLGWRRGFRRPRLLIAGGFVGVCLIGLSAGNAVLVWPKLHAAIVIGAQSPVRAAPAPLGDALFVLPEGETVEITAEHEDFVLVKTLDGRTGWLAQAAVARIVPRK